jgi:AAHS family benzoate transporter-like MFS transporter
MLRAEFNAEGSLSFLLVFERRRDPWSDRGSRVADRLGPKPAVAGAFLTGAVAIALLTPPSPLGILLFIVAVARLGASGTQTLIYGFVANYYRTNVRGAGVAWCAGFGRLDRVWTVEQKREIVASLGSTLAPTDVTNHRVGMR